MRLVFQALPRGATSAEEYLHAVQQVDCAGSCSAFRLCTVSLTDFISPLWDLLNVNKYIGFL